MGKDIYLDPHVCLSIHHYPLNPECFLNSSYCEPVRNFLPKCECNKGHRNSAASILYEHIMQMMCAVLLHLQSITCPVAPTNIQLFSLSKHL